MAEGSSDDHNRRKMIETANASHAHRGCQTVSDELHPLALVTAGDHRGKCESGCSVTRRKGLAGAEESAFTVNFVGALAAGDHLDAAHQQLGMQHSLKSNLSGV